MIIRSLTVETLFQTYKQEAGMVANVLDCDIIVSSNSLHVITFTFRLIPLGKVWTLFFPALSYDLNSTLVFREMVNFSNIIYY